MAEAKSRREAPVARQKRAKAEFAADLQDELPPLPTPVKAEPGQSADDGLPASPAAETSSARCLRLLNGPANRLPAPPSQQPVRASRQRGLGKLRLG